MNKTKVRIITNNPKKEYEQNETWTESEQRLYTISGVLCLSRPSSTAFHGHVSHKLIKKAFFYHSN